MLTTVVPACLHNLQRVQKPIEIDIHVGQNKISFVPTSVSCTCYIISSEDELLSNSNCLLYL